MGYRGVSINAYILLDHYSNIILTNIIDARALQSHKMSYDGTVILDNIRCIGSEGNLTDCSGSGYGHFGGCSYIAVAICEGIIVTRDIHLHSV